MSNRTGYLTIYSADRAEVYGEFCDADWEIEDTSGGSNHVFSGTASEGAFDTFRRINYEGISNVEYTFESNGYRYVGSAQLLAPNGNGMPGGAVIRIATGDRPSRA
jgi:hypothetical protein